MVIKKEKILILGAGLAGLSAAYHLKQGYSLYEKEPEPGGMARSIDKDGYTFDYDGHLMHFRNDYTFTLLKELLEGNLAAHKRSSWIYSKKIFTKYPFQANFYGLPKNIVKDCLLGLIKAKKDASSSSVSPNGNFENWINKTFGEGIAEHFMLPYNRKFWNFEPKEITCEWLDGFVPMVSLEDAVSGAISSNTKSYGYNSRFWYPVKGGIREVVKGFLKNIKACNTNKKAISIDQRKKEVFFEDGERASYEGLVSTMPLPELGNVLVDLPKDIKQAFLNLKYISIFVLNLGIKRDDITDKHWVYYPESDLKFYRVGFPTNFSMDVAPSGRTSLYAEVSYRDKCINKGAVARDIIESLKKINIIEDESDVETSLPIDIKYGYVLYDKLRKPSLELIQGYLKEFGIYSIGRYGSWKYMSMEDVILEGKETADSLKV